MGKFKEMKKQIMANDDCPKIQNYDNAIHISIKDNSEIISPFSEDNLAVINSEFASFLENSVKDVPIKQDLTLEITTQKGDLNTISNAVKNYYNSLLYSQNLNLNPPSSFIWDVDANFHSGKAERSGNFLSALSATAST